MSTLPLFPENPPLGRYKGAPLIPTEPAQTEPVKNDAQEAAVRRDDAIAKAEGGAEALKSHRAFEALKRVARRQQYFIIDQVQDEWQEAFTEGRAMGAVTMRAIREGLIEGTNEYRASARVNCHKNPRRVFRSLIFEGGAE